jgi:hypothetical protein
MADLKELYDNSVEKEKSSSFYYYIFYFNIILFSLDDICYRRGYDEGLFSKETELNHFFEEKIADIEMKHQTELKKIMAKVLLLLFILTMMFF